MDNPLLLAVTGFPVAHSLSPVLFNRMFELCRLRGRYLRLAAPNAETALSTARELGLWGLNITAPFKKDIFINGIEPDNDVRRIGAANFVRFGPERAHALNTDHVGVTEALRANGISILKKTTIVLGAGPAAQAAAWGLKTSGAADVIIINRTPEKARKAALHLDCSWSPADRLSALINQADIIVSCIPESPYRRIISSLLPGQVFLNADYSADKSRKAVHPNQALVISGREWLFRQALPVMTLLNGKNLSKNIEALIHREMILSRNEGKKHIALAGMSGSGKSTVGAALSRLMHCDFLDSDSEVSKTAGKPIGKIFSLEGEYGFRKRERESLDRIIHDSKPKTISLGGGAVLDPDIRLWLKKNCFVIWLWTGAEESVRRILSSHRRPLVSTGNPENDYLEILKQRKFIYAGISDMVMRSDDGNGEEIARRIQNEMDKAIGN